MTIQEVTDKVSGIAVKKFGCSISFTRVTKDIYSDILTRNLGAQFIIVNPDILLPVYIDDDIFGVISIHDGANLDFLSLNNVQEFAADTLKEFIINQETLRRTKIEEARLEAQQISNNVLPLRKMQQEIILESAEDPQSNMISYIGLLNGNETRTHKMAVDLHDILNRRGFLPFLEMNFSANTIHDELLTMGRVTLYISEVSNLEPQIQLELAKYLKQYHLKKTPLFVFGSQFSFEQIKESKIVSDELLEIIAHNSIDISMLEFATRSDLKDYFQNLVGLN